MRALVSSRSLTPKPWLEGPEGNPRLPGTALLEDLLYHLSDQGIDEVLAPSGDALERSGLLPGMRREELRSVADDVMILVSCSGPFRCDFQRLRATLLASEADCVIALLAQGRRSSLPRIFADPLGRPQLIQKPDHPEPVTNLRHTGIRVIRTRFAPAALDASPFTAPVGDLRILCDTASCSHQRDILTPESFLLCCHDFLAGRISVLSRSGAGSDKSIASPSSGASSAPGRNVWLAENVRLGKDTVLENTVVLSGARIGDRCRLRSTLVLPGTVVASGTDCSDKYLSVLGMDRR